MRPSPTFQRILCLCSGALALACSDSASLPSSPLNPGPEGAVEGGTVDAGATSPEASAALEPGTRVDASAPSADESAFEALRAQVEVARSFDAAGLREAYALKFAGPLMFDPNAAEFMDRIQASALALSASERTVLGASGFVISTRREFPTFLRGLSEIYSEHLPVYITADALLEAIHSSYDTLLAEFESVLLIDELASLLTGMHQRLAASSADAETKADTDVYLTVARSLLAGSTLAPVSGGDPALIASLVKGAEAADGLQDTELFQVQRVVDFSQFTPRGHYTGTPELSRYFRAMIWLGRIDFRLIETQPSGSTVFRRRQYAATLLMQALVAPDVERFARIDDVIRTFVGESDYMVLSEVASLIADLGGPLAAQNAADEQVVQAIVKGDYGAQQIASHFMINDTVDTLPLNRSFALFGQRYVVDSHVFSEVVYDRLTAKRMMPTPLDAAFAALGNGEALNVHPDLAHWEELPGALGRMRVAIDAHDESFWSANFYNLWLTALRALSPATDLSEPGALGLPQVAGSEGWAKRLLNAQLGSWAELRHDTLLYAKQSYTGVPSCDYPDAYVDPYPAFYRALHDYAAAGQRLTELLPSDRQDWSAKVTGYFAALERIAGLLGDMAERELRGEPFSDEQLAFINDAVRIESQSAGCATVDVPDGWYADLFYERDKSIEFDPTIADVHTQPADEAGNSVGRVLHVGTGYPRMMVTTVDTCMGPRAYAGVVLAYHELITENFERLTDETWATRFSMGPRPSDVSWLADVLSE